MDYVELGVPFPQLSASHDNKKIAYIDIETTGFMSDNNHIYLIGLAIIKNKKPYFMYLFAKDTDEEKGILIKLMVFIKDYNLLIHFNGLTFDIPFIEKRCQFHGIRCELKTYDQLDLYKIIYSKKKYLNINGYKQKDIELALGINREDIYNGRELIRLYHAYQSMLALTSDNAKNEADNLFDTLLKHNYEDIKYLVKISHILDLKTLYTEDIIHDCIVKDGILELSCRCDYTDSSVISEYINLFNKSFLGIKDIALDSDGEIHISVNIFSGELKMFFENYKDYYYLPVEDCAIHKSVARYVDADYRVNATKDTCYIKKNGDFIALNLSNKDLCKRIKKLCENENVKLFSHKRNDQTVYILVEANAGEVMLSKVCYILLSTLLDYLI